MSTMLFYAIKEGRTTGVNDRVYRFGWPMTVPDQSITWLHLGSMTSGYVLADNPGARCLQRLCDRAVLPDAVHAGW
jgi:hypothetical protein